MSALNKSLQEKLDDAAELIRRKNLELTANRKLIEQLRKTDDTAEAIRQVIFGLAAHSPEPPAWVSKIRTGSGDRGTPVVVWSDWHYGEVINPDEIGGVNAYNKTIAKARIKKLVDAGIDLAENHMGESKIPYPGVVVCLGGDMVGGDIHEELLATNDRTVHQSVNDLTDILAAALETMATRFGRVLVPCVVGNHGRSTRKPPMKHRVFTNYDWTIYSNLERYFRKDKRVHMYVPNGADAHFNVAGHRFLLTHGDSLGVKGGDGIIGAIGPIMRGLIKLHNSKAQINQDFDTAIICHWHQYISLQGLVVNGALKGYDEFAFLALRAKFQVPTQALLFVHSKRGITAQWPMYLEDHKHAISQQSWAEWPQ